MAMSLLTLSWLVSECYPVSGNGRGCKTGQSHAQGIDRKHDSGRRVVTDYFSECREGMEDLLKTRVSKSNVEVLPDIQIVSTLRPHLFSEHS